MINNKTLFGSVEFTEQEKKHIVEALQLLCFKHITNEKMHRELTNLIAKIKRNL